MRRILRGSWIAYGDIDHNVLPHGDPAQLHETEGPAAEFAIGREMIITKL